MILPQQKRRQIRNTEAGGDLSLSNPRGLVDVHLGEIEMTKFSKTLLALVAAAASFGVMAQTSTVDLKNAKQSQSGGLANSQGANIGNASGTAAKSNVTANQIGQSQSGGLANSQKMDLGNASGSGQTKVTATNVKQSQSGGLANSQKIELGNASKGKSDVKASNVTQDQSGGLANSQKMSAGNTK